jgi:hypothetical protein
MGRVPNAWEHAGAAVTDDAEAGQVLVGVPAAGEGLFLHPGRPDGPKRLANVPRNPSYFPTS